MKNERFFIFFSVDNNEGGKGNFAGKGIILSVGATLSRSDLDNSDIFQS